MAAETITIDVVVNFKNNTSGGMNQAKSSADKFTQSIQKAKKEVDRLGGTNAQPKVSLMDRASSTISKIDRGLTTLSGKTIKAGVRIVDYATRPLRAIKNSLFSIKGLVAAIGAGFAGKKLLAEPIGLADQYSSAKIGFSTLLGDQQGQKMMDDLDKFAKETPFKTSNTIAQAQKMIAMGWNAKDIVSDMKVIGDAAAATGKGDEGLQRIVLALSQIKSKGKLSTEELNQLAEAGISAKRYIAEGLGYGSGDTALAQMSKDLEKGAIGSEAAIQAIMQGMKEYDGMMDKTANETVEGLKSQIEDTFEINIFRKWGQGLQDGAKRGLGSIVELLNSSEDDLARFGDTLHDIGQELSNWAADKLEGTIDKILEISNRDDFKNASLFGKAKILWDEVIAQPFGEWWDSKGKPYIMGKMESLGEGLGSTLSKGLLAILGVDISDSATIGSSFAKGFQKGFEGMKVWNALVKAAGRVFTTGFSALFNAGPVGKAIATGIALKITTGTLSGLSKIQTLWSGTGALTNSGTQTLSGMGLKGILGSTGNAMVNGSGVLGNLASLGYAVTGGAATSTMSGGMAALAGAGTAAGIVGGVAGLGNSIVDLTKTIKSNTKNDRKLYGTRSATKAGMVATGALIGTAIAPGIGTAIGAGLGGIATFVAGNKLADSISGVSKSTAELNEEAERLAEIDLKKRFGEITLSATQLSDKVKDIIGNDTISRVNKFNTAMADLRTVQDSISGNKDTIGLTHERIMNKEKLSESDIQNYKNSLEEYANSVSNLMKSNKTATTSAFQLLYGDDKKGLQNATKTMNSAYTKLESQLSERSAKLNEVIADAFEDGKIDIDEEKKIDEIVKQIEAIEKAIEDRMAKKKEAESNATYDLIAEKYKNTDLTADSFKDLIGELNSQNEVDLQGYDDAYIKAKAEIDVELEDGSISKSEYDNLLDDIEKKWRTGKARTIKQTVEVSLEVLENNYGSQLTNIESALNNSELAGTKNIKKLKDASYKSSRYGFSVAKWDKGMEAEFEGIQQSFLKGIGADKTVQKEMKGFYDSLKPQEEDLQELKKSYEDAGKQVPQWIEDSLGEIENIKLMSGDVDTFYRTIGEQIAQEDAIYAEELKGMSGIPDALKEGIEEGLKHQTVDFDTNLKVSADSSKIDTSGLDEATKSVVEKLESEGILKIEQGGDVSIKAKDGKIDTTGLDEDTKKAIDKLEKEGVIQIDKEGKVTIKAKSVDTKEAKSKADKKTKSEVGKDTKVKKGAKVTVKEKSTNTKGAKAKADKKTKSEVGKDTNVDKGANVTVKEKSTNTSSAKSTSDKKTKSALKGPYSVSASANVSIGLGSLTGLGGIVSSVVSKAKSALGNIDLSTGSKRQFASGGFVNGATASIVGEDGPEAIIPLGAKRRKRGMDLWLQAGRAMGVQMFADGGITGENTENKGSSIGNIMSKYGIDSSNNTEFTHNVPETNTAREIKVNVDGITIEINASGNGVAADIENSKDSICNVIAEALQEAFQNLPLATE